MGGETVERARYRWRELLPRFGVPTDYLRNRHGPCPICGGRDRFRFDDKDGSGSYFCNQCGPGTGMILVQKVNNWTFREAADAVDGVIGTAAAPASPAATAPPDDPERRRQAIKRTLREANSPRIVEAEFARRGLSAVPRILRGHPGLPYYGADGGFVGRFPAVLAPVAGADRTLQGCHRIYCDRTLKPRKKLMRPVDTIKGGAVRLFDPGKTLGIAEGVETAIACREIFGVPVWAALSANGLEAWQPPDGVRRVMVFGDCDSSYAGQKAAYALAARLQRDGYAVEVHIPPDPDTDWLDALDPRKAAA